MSTTVRMFKLPNGHTFYLQLDGTVTDTPNPDHADFAYDSLGEFMFETDAKEVFDADNVSRYWLARFQESLSAEDDSKLSEFPIDSVCGQACVEIMDKAAALLDVCDPHAEIKKHVLAGSLIAVQIVCFG